MFQGFVALDKFFKAHLLTCIHATICSCHLSSVTWVALVNQMLEEGSYMELLIFRHLCDLLGYLGD